MSKPQVVGMISKILFRVYIYLKDKFDPKYPITQEEIYCHQICLTLINCEDSHLTISPISNKRFIKNTSKDIFVIINNKQITLINNVYGFNLVMEDDDMYDKMIKNFDSILEERRQKIENEMMENVRNSLELILKKVKSSPLEL